MPGPRRFPSANLNSVLERDETVQQQGELLIIDEPGFVPLSKTGAELLFEVFSQRYERGAIVITSNLPFDEWTEIFGSERLHYRDNPQQRLRHHIKWTGFTPPNWTDFAPPLTCLLRNGAVLVEPLWPLVCRGDPETPHSSWILFAVALAS